MTNVYDKCEQQKYIEHLLIKEMISNYVFTNNNLDGNNLQVALLHLQ